MLPFVDFVTNIYDEIIKSEDVNMNYEFYSLKEICDVYDIEYKEDAEYVKKQLKDMQWETHPDLNPDDADANKRSCQLNAAYDFIKKYQRKRQELVTVSDIAELIQTANKKNELAMAIKENESIIEESYEKSLKQIKYSFLPAKITTSTITGIITFIWSFPSSIEQNPVFGDLINKYGETDFFSYLTMAWIIALSSTVLAFFYAKYQKSKCEAILYNFKNKSFQYNVFSNFIKEKSIIKKSNSNNLSFYRKELESFILDEILRKNRKKHFRLRKNHNIMIYLDELLPKLSEIIINRAIEQKIIAKSDEAIWEDKYIIIAPDAFND